MERKARFCQVDGKIFHTTSNQLPGQNTGNEQQQNGSSIDAPYLPVGEEDNKSKASSRQRRRELTKTTTATTTIIKGEKHWDQCAILLSDRSSSIGLASFGIIGTHPRSPLLLSPTIVDTREEGGAGQRKQLVAGAHHVDIESALLATTTTNY